MLNTQSTITTLFSSNSTIQYAKDIFSVLSLPRGSHFQFRYQHNYIDPRVISIFSNTKKRMDLRALVAFRSNYTAPDNDSFCIPIRWVRIQSVAHLPNGYAVNFEIDGYPKFTPEFSSKCTSFQGINQSANHFFKQLGNNDYAVWGEALSFVNPEDDLTRDGENWLEIVRKLTTIPTYKDYHFLKCSPLYTEHLDKKTGTYQKVECPKQHYLTKFVEGKCVNIDIEYYSDNYDATKKRQIDIWVDTHILNKASGLRTALQSRYGTIKLGLQSKTVANNTITEVVINTSSSVTDELQTELTFPVVIVKNKAYKLAKAIITGIGALFVALPGIIGDNLNLAWNILIAGIGVLVLGINNYWESKE